MDSSVSFLPPLDRNVRLMETRRNMWGSTVCQPVDQTTISSTRFYPVINSFECYPSTVYQVIDYNDSEHCQLLLCEAERFATPKPVEMQWMYPRKDSQQSQEENAPRRQHTYERRSVKDAKKSAQRKVTAKDPRHINIMMKEELTQDFDAGDKIVEIRREWGSDEESAYAELGPEDFVMEEDVLSEDEELRRELDIFMSNLRDNKEQ